MTQRPLTEDERAALERLWQTAVHEATHAVVACLLRVRHGHLSIRPSKRLRSTGSVRLLEPRRFTESYYVRQAIVTFAPFFRSAWVSTGTAMRGCGSDLNDVAYMLGLSLDQLAQPAVKDPLSDVTMDVLEVGADAIGAVAHAALTSPTGRLSARTIRALVRGQAPLWYGATAPRAVVNRKIRRLVRVVVNRKIRLLVSALDTAATRKKGRKT